MKKTLIQFAVLVLLFLGVWKGLSLVPWVKTLHVKQLNDKTLKKLGDAVLAAYQMDKKEVQADSMVYMMNVMKQRLCDANGIDTAVIHLHAFEDKVVNAFALPGGHIVVNTALIKYCDNADMLAGVVAHEIAHIRNNHITERMMKEVGISAIVLATGGGEHVGVIKSILQMLASKHFDRGQETEADNTAVAYLENAEVNPKEMAAFFKKLAVKEQNMPEAFKWISTHPYSQERANNISKKYNRQINYTPCINAAVWQYVQGHI